MFHRPSLEREEAARSFWMKRMMSTRTMIFRALRPRRFKELVDDAERKSPHQRPPEIAADTAEDHDMKLSMM